MQSLLEIQQKKLKKMKNKKIRKYSWGEDPEMSGPRNYFRESLIVAGIRKYKQKGKILDAGCGSGSLSLRFGFLGYSVSAVDLAERSLQYVRVKAKQLGLTKRITVQKGSIVKLPFKANNFDGVVCGEVLEHIPTDVKAISELYRVLKQNGVCVVTVPAHPHMWDLSDDISGHERRYTKEELKRKFMQAGFHVKYCNYWGFPLNNLWHTYLFVPFLANKMKQSKNITQEKSLTTTLIKSPLFQKIVSWVFYFDFLFTFTQKGNGLFLIAQK